MELPRCQELRSALLQMFSHVIFHTVQGALHSNSHGTVRELHFKQFKYSAQESTIKTRQTLNSAPVLQLQIQRCVSSIQLCFPRKTAAGSNGQGDLTVTAMGWDLAGSPSSEIP